MTEDARGNRPEPSSELKQDRLLQELLKFARAHGIFAVGDRVLLAVSGGLDSTALLHLLNRAARLLEIHLEVAHIDHRQRGATSEREARWVRVLCEREHLTFHPLQLEAPVGSSQAALRDLRRQALRALAKDVGADKIATAHHADDNAETLLMRAISGTGPQGLASISPQNHPWVRPLLFATRKEIEEYVRSQGLIWVEDPSNQRGEYLRNQIRHELLPKAELLRAGSIRNLARLAERVDEEERSFEAWISAQLEGPVNTLPLHLLEKWPVPLKRRLVRIWLARQELDPQPALIEALLKGEELLHLRGAFLRRSDSLHYLPERPFGELWATPVPIDMMKRQPLGGSLAWSFLPAQREGELRALDLSIFLTFRAPAASDPTRLTISWEKCDFPLALRARTKDDPAWIEAALRKKQIPKPYQKAWPLLVSRAAPQRIVAGVGLEVSQEFQLEGAQRCLCLEHHLSETDAVRNRS